MAKHHGVHGQYSYIYLKCPQYRFVSKLLFIIRPRWILPLFRDMPITPVFSRDLCLSLCPSVFQWLFVSQWPPISVCDHASMYHSDYAVHHAPVCSIDYVCHHASCTPVIMFVTIPHCTQMNMFVTMPPVYSIDYVCRCGPSILHWLCLSLWLQYTPVIVFVTMAPVYSSDYVCHFSILQWLCFSLWPQYTAVIMFVTMAPVYCSNYVFHYGPSILQ